MSEEVNLSEESNNPEEDVLDQDFLLEKVDEMRDLIHQQRFTECKPILVAIFENCPNHKQYMRRLMHGLLKTVLANMSLLQCKKLPDDMLGFLKQYVKPSEELDIPEMTPEARTKFVFGAVSELDQLLVDIEMDIRSDQGIFKDLKKQGEAIDIKEVKPTLEKFVSREAMLFLNHDLSKEEQDQASARLYQEWEEFREKIFDRFVSSGYWNNEERAVVKDTILSPTVDSLTSQLLVSAITLSAATVFDMGKFTLLYDIYRLADDDEVKVRALLGWLLVSTNCGSYEQQPDFRSFAEQLTEDCKNDPDLLAEIIKAQKMLAVTVFSEQKSIDYTNDIMASLSKRFLDDLRDKVADLLEADEDMRNIFGIEDDEETSEESPIRSDDTNTDEDGIPNLDADIESPLSMDEMMDKGIDILLPQFKMLRDQTEFFTHLYNWFMPFYLKNPHITEALGFVDEKRKFCKAFCSTARSCPADAYSLANLIVSHPNEIPENIVDCYDDPEDEEDGSESADEEEIVKEFFNEPEEHHAKRIRINYIRNLMRFSKFYTAKDEIFNILDELDDDKPAYAVLAGPLFQDEFFDKYRMAIARYSFRREFPDLVEVMLEGVPCDTLEMHFMKGWVCMQKGDNHSLRMAVDHFKKMLKIKPDMKQVYLQLGTCYRNLIQVDEYLENFDKLMEFKDSFSEEELFELKLDKLKFIVMNNRFEEAMPLAYELDYTHPENQMAGALLTQLLIKIGGEHAEENFQKAHQRLDEYFAEVNELFGSFEKMKKAGKDTKNMMMQAMDLFFKMMKNDKLAEAYNNYSLGLLALIEHQPKKAMGPFFRVYAYYVEKDENVFFEALKEDYKWLKNYGCSYTDLMIIYNQVVAEHQKSQEEIKKYADKSE
ncbi:tetratricopeptide repeat protein [Segatella copri]|uniref:tetratricopeptide repeat protein n=1 Tax=Segatella copri TaxID=165179 RepID=UPI003F887CF9